MRREISRILSEEVSDPAISNVFITNVTLTPDKQSARVIVSATDSSSEESMRDAIRALNRAAGFIQRSLAGCLQLRHVPRLKFEFDRAKQAEERIETLLNRIQKRASKGGTGLVLFLLFLTQPMQAGQGLERFESSTDVMGSEFRIACYAPTTSLAAGAVTAAFAEVRRIDEFLSNYRPDSELSRINREAQGGPLAISTEMGELLAACLRYHKVSNGAFDITVGALVDTWGFFRGDGKLPSWWSLWLARRNVGSQHLKLDHENKTVTITRSGLSLDPGGIGKGYAVDRAVDALREYGIDTALISAGTSSIYALGSPPASPNGWALDIRNPSGGSDSVETVYLTNESLSTSGADEKFFEVDGKRYAHIFDPRTGQPAEGVRSVSVIAPLAIDSEVWTTTIFVNGVEWARANRPPDTRVFVCPESEDCSWLD